MLGTPRGSDQSRDPIDGHRGFKRVCRGDDAVDSSNDLYLVAEVTSLEASKAVPSAHDSDIVEICHRCGRRSAKRAQKPNGLCYVLGAFQYFCGGKKRLAEG